MVSLREVKPAVFSEENEKHWIEPKKGTRTARSCRGGHILQHSFPEIIWSLLSMSGNEESQNWGGLTTETTSQLQTFLGTESIFYTSCANSMSSSPKLWLNKSVVGPWLWIRLVEWGLTCLSGGPSHQAPEILPGWNTYKVFNMKIQGNFQRRAFIFSMPKDSAHQFGFKVNNPSRWLLDQDQADVRKF